MRKILCILILALLLSGCGKVESLPETTLVTEVGGVARQPLPEERILAEPFRENRELEYVKWRYDNWHDADGSWVNPGNLTGTYEREAPNEMFREGWRLITSAQAYEKVLGYMTQVEKTCTKEIGTYRGPYVILDTCEKVFDEAFFEKYSLVVVDFTNEGAYHLESRLDSVTVSGGTASVAIRYETMYAVTAEAVGDVYWIPVPKDCTELEVELTEVEWDGREEPYVYDTLSEEELAEFQTLFDDPMGWYARALTSQYSSASGVDLGKMFYCGAGETPVSAEEREYLQSQWIPELFDFDIVRCDEEAMEEAFQLVFGHGLNNRKHRVGLEKMTYYNGAYFAARSDVLVAIVQLQRGRWINDGEVWLYYASDEPGVGECCVAMRYADGRWVIRSNMQVD